MLATVDKQPSRCESGGMSDTFPVLVAVKRPDGSTENVRVGSATHKPAALYEAFPPQEARRILRRIEFHHTPKHASWLDMAEIEIGAPSA